MPLTGDEIIRRLAAFAAHWSLYDGSERAEAQTFVNELFQCYGANRQRVGAEFEAPRAGGFLDLLWPGVCLIEMKAPSEAERLWRHRPQALGYWASAADPGRGIASPTYVVICAFHTFEVWEPGRFPNEPRAVFDLEELPHRYDALFFLAREEPVFRGSQVAVTTEAAQAIARLNASLADRRESGPDERRDFLLQAVWCMFAEDLGQLPGHRFTALVDELIRAPTRSSADDLGLLFEHLNDPSPERPARGLYAGAPYVNGRLFQRPARVHLVGDELELLRAACEFDWRRVDPQIFGSLLEGTLGRDRQWELGAHYTHEAEIQKIVQPTIVEPWRERIENIASHREAVAAQADLMQYVVLDPACGSGNFLYVAYRELRRLEARLRELETELRRREGLPDQQAISLFFPIQNMRGIEIEHFPVSLARVTLWMGHRLAVEELQLSERTLPLVDLSGIQRADALAVEWPRADAIIGNPPYQGSQQLRSLFPEAYLEWLQTRFDCGLKDLCVYWFRRAIDHMEPGARAGLVGTNSISQNRARGASLNYVVEKGGVITSAVSRQKWPGAAVVNVSIVNWVKAPEESPERFMLDGDEVVGISTRLREATLAVEEYERLAANAGRAFQGPIPAGNFYLEPAEAQRLLARDDADYTEVVRLYLNGEDITEDPRHAPRRYVIDFAIRSLEGAMRYPAALDLVRVNVKPDRDRNNRRSYRENWWRFAEARPGMRRALEPFARFIAGNAQGKRFLFTWQDWRVCPSNLTNVFAFDDDYTMGVLTSSAHQAWAHSEASSLETRPRYTPTTCFETFPWPDADDGQRERIGQLAARLYDRRLEICSSEGIGLTEFYNRLDEGAWTDVRDLHSELDVAVAEAYGWSASVAGDPLEIRTRLGVLNELIVSGGRPYDPFGAVQPPSAGP